MRSSWPSHLLAEDCVRQAASSAVCGQDVLSGNPALSLPTTSVSLFFCCMHARRSSSPMITGLTCERCGLFVPAWYTQQALGRSYILAMTVTCLSVAPARTCACTRWRSRALHRPLHGTSAHDTPCTNNPLHEAMNMIDQRAATFRMLPPACYNHVHVRAWLPACAVRMYA